MGWQSFQPRSGFHSILNVFSPSLPITMKYSFNKRILDAIPITVIFTIETVRKKSSYLNPQRTDSEKKRAELYVHNRNVVTRY